MPVALDLRRRLGYGAVTKINQIQFILCIDVKFPRPPLMWVRMSPGQHKPPEAERCPG